MGQESWNLCSPYPKIVKRIGQVAFKKKLKMSNPSHTMHNDRPKPTAIGHLSHSKKLINNKPAIACLSSVNMQFVRMSRARSWRIRGESPGRSRKDSEFTQNLYNIHKSCKASQPTQSLSNVPYIQVFSHDKIVKMWYRKYLNFFICFCHFFLQLKKHEII